MKHKVFGRKLGRDIKERTALFRSLANALIDHGKITTTWAKAQAVRPQIEKTVTHAKNGSVQSVRQVTSFLNKPKNVRRLVDEIAPQLTSTGGYVRIYRLGVRMGDNAQQAVLQWSITPTAVEVLKEGKDPQAGAGLQPGPKQLESKPEAKKTSRTRKKTV